VWIVGWYACAIVSNLALKAYLGGAPTLAHVVLATWTAFAVASWPFFVRVVRGGGGGGRWARMRAELTRDALIVGLLHAAATGLTNVAILAASLAYAHTVKATEPLFTAVLSRQLLRERLPWPALAAVVTVVAGVALTSWTEGTLSPLGLAAALASNVASATRAVLFKRAYGAGDTGGGGGSGGDSALDAFSRMSYVAAVALTPLLLLVATVVPTMPLAAVAGGAWTTPTDLAALLAVASLTSAGYFACSFEVLTRIPAVAHALVNVMKRVAIIVTSLALFRSAVSPANAVGLVLANVGIAAYAMVLRARTAETAVRAPTSAV
jgi:solute carrier family 35, member E1